MKRHLLVLPLLTAGACESQRARVYSPVRTPVYQALGSEPFWSLAIGDDRIVLWSSLQDGERSWPRTLPRTTGEVRRWESGQGAGAIVIEARPGPCETEGQEIFEDEVAVRVDGVALTGCGGRLIGREDE